MRHIDYEREHLTAVEWGIYGSGVPLPNIFYILGIFEHGTVLIATYYF